MQNKILFVLLMAIFGLGMANAPELARNQSAIDFSLKDISDKEVKLSDFKGKGVFLNFWATWCSSCREEMPSMQELHEKFQKENFVILAVSIDRGGAGAVKPFVNKNRYTFKVLLDPGGRVASLYKVSGIPSAFIIDKNGKIVDRFVGPRDWADESAVKALQKLLKP